MRLVNPHPYAVDIPALGIDGLPAGETTPDLEPSEHTASLLEQGWTDPDAVVELPDGTDGTGQWLPPADNTVRETPAVDEHPIPQESPDGDDAQVLKSNTARRQRGASASTKEN